MVGFSVASTLLLSRKLQTEESAPEATQLLKTRDTDYRVNENDDYLGISGYITSISDKTKSAIGLASWALGSVQVVFSKISEQECQTLATQIAEECQTNGDAIVLNYNGGVHTAILVRTNVGLAYLAYPLSWSHRPLNERADKVAPSAKANLESQSNTDQIAIRHLAKEIQFYKSHDLDKHMTKLSDMNTKIMIETYLELDEQHVYNYSAFNCATVSGIALHRGLPKNIRCLCPELTRLQLLPKRVQWCAQQISSTFNHLQMRSVKTNSQS